MEGQNYSVKERLEQLEALMGKYTAWRQRPLRGFFRRCGQQPDLKGSSKGSYEGWQQGLCSYL